MLRSWKRLAAVLTLWGMVALQASGQQTSPRIERLEVEPRVVQLNHARDRQQILVTGVTAVGRKVDVTHRCRIALPGESVARLEGSVVRGVANGRSTLSVQYGGQTATVSVRVRGCDRLPAVHFRNDVVPLLTKLGCNSGACHGKQSGQNGFKLSVFSFDPRADYEAIVKESRGRRIFPGDPEQGLILAKPTARAPHGGGRRIEPGSWEYGVLLDWLKQGAPWGADNAPRVVDLLVSPRERIANFGASQQLLATAVFSDGSRQDVTAAAVYATNAPLVAEADERGVVRVGNAPGEAAITVSYLGQVTAAGIQVPRPDQVIPFPRPPANNRIDELVWDKLEKLGIVPAPLCDDATFIRRVFLDAIGAPPTPQEVLVFLHDKRPDKRRRLIDRVLEREEFADYWALKWADILLVDADKLGPRGAYEFHGWLREQLARNRPYDEWVRELITASGDSSRRGPVNFFRAVRTPEETAEAVSQAFLGVRIECAQCHHHPWEKWGREDFYALAGFFNNLVRKPRGENRELVFHGGHRAMKLPVSGEEIPTRVLGGEAAPNPTGDPRLVLARWLTSPQNPWFAKLAANRLWKHFLGRGLVEPEDDFRSTNPPTNAPLLKHLEQQVAGTGFDLKGVMKLILRSRVYQLSGETNPTNTDDVQNFSRHYPQRLPAEVLLDAICHATGTPERFSGHPPGTRAVQLWDNRLPSYFLKTFGRPLRDSPCECGRSGEPTVAQALHLMNAPQIEAKISHPTGRVSKLLEAGAGQDEIVRELCLAALGRLPAKKEQDLAGQLFRAAPRADAAEDFLWVLLNSYDFIFVW